MPSPLYYEYATFPGDSLNSLMLHFYGLSPPTNSCSALRERILAMNPHIGPNHDKGERLSLGTLLRLPDVNGAVSNVTSHRFMSAHSGTHERQQLWAMAWAEQAGLLSGVGGVTTDTGKRLLNKGNIHLLRQIGDEYAAYKKSGGSITKGQYDYRRRLLVKKISDNFGPLERTLFRGASSPQALRIARAGGLPYDHHLANHAGHLKRLGSLASKTGIVLAGVGAAAACVEIAHTEDRQKQNEIFVDTVVTTVAGFAMGVFVISNPIGWGTALVLACGSAVGSYSLGKGAVKLYNNYYSEVDLVRELGVNRLCK